MAELHELTALEQWIRLQAGAVSPLELAQHYLARIDRLNPELGAFVTVSADAARGRARDLPTAVPRSAILWGLPSGDKDLWLREGVATGFGSRLMAGFVPDRSDELVKTLDAAGAVSLGKTNTPEFGLPSYTESLAAPPARNPWETSLGAGGSSGGAAVAVASGMLPFAPGSDGGGSIRIPAAACGLVGLKPSRGLVPGGSGMESLGGLAVAGPLARTVSDAALLLDGMIARTSDGRIDHHFTLRAPGGDEPYLSAAVRAEGRFQLGVMTSSAWDAAYELELDPDARRALEIAVTGFAALGHGIEQTWLDPDETYAGAFHTLWRASASRIPVENSEQEALLEPLTRWLVRSGRGLSAAELSAALSVLSAYERMFLHRFARYDAVLTPALALTPRPLGWYDQEDAEHNFEQQVRYTPFTSMVNVTGLPAVVLPVHQTASGLPMGVQLIGRPGGERTLLALGAQLERCIGWQRRHPPCW